MEINSGISCRICKSTSGNDLIESPCLCKGTLGYIHFSCLENWLNQACRDYCELCQYRFQAIQSRRYGLLRSLCVWVSNPRNRLYLCYDMLIAVVLTALTITIIFICLVGAGVLIRNEKGGLEDPFVRVVIMVFLFILMSSYMTTLYLIVQDHVRPWYRWWRNCVNVRLLIDPNKLHVHHNNAHKVSQTNPLPVINEQSTEMLSLTQTDSSPSFDKLNDVDKTKTPFADKKMPNSYVVQIIE